MTDEVMFMSDEEFIERSLRKRVRLFNLSSDSNWCERGLGQVSIHYLEKLKRSFLLVISEEDDSLLLQSEILPDTAYNKQQERFIIWTEKGTVFGLSFQEHAGCDDVWNTICQVQGKDPSSLENSANIKQELEEPIAIKNEIEDLKYIKVEVDDLKDIKVEVDESKNTVRVEVEDIEDVIKHEAEDVEDVNQESLLEEMLDIEQLSLSAYERDVLGQLIELVNRLVTPIIDDKLPYTSAEDRQLLDLFHMGEDVLETENLKQMNEIISYISMFNRSRH